MRSASLVIAVVLTAVSTTAADVDVNAPPRHIEMATAPIPLDVNVYDRAAVTGIHMAGALATAANLYKSANVHLKWHSASHVGTPARRLTIVVVAADSLLWARAESLDTLGRVIQPGVRAYLLYDRVVKFARDHRVDPATVLGQAIAHEIGHLLLGTAHSSKGVMAAQIDPLGITEIAFTSDETRAIRARLTASRRHGEHDFDRFALAQHIEPGKCVAEQQSVCD